MTEPCCNDIGLHSHDGGRTLWRHGQPADYRTAFEWRWPRVAFCVAADPRPFAVHINHYHGMRFPIGVAVQVRRRVLSLLWARPGRITWTTR